MRTNETLILIKMIEEGIIPYKWPRDTLESGFGSLSSQDQDRVRRKFRKLWRKALRYHSPSPGVFDNLSRQCGVGLSKDDLRYSHYLHRAKLVYDMLDFTN